MTPSRLGVLVTHPGRQHSHQAAIALERAGQLAGYWAGVPSSRHHADHLPAALRRRLIRYDPLPIAEPRLRWLPAVPALRRAADALMPPRIALHADYFACRWFDRRVARRLRPGTARAVIACEISARDTFERARSFGMMTILDAPSLHHATQDRLHGTADPPRLHRRIAAVKDAEIERADHIVTVSRFARDSYLAAGVAPGRVHAVPLGADLARFRPGEEGPRRGGQGVRLLFAGATIPRKGFDLLLTAFARLRAELPQARLRVVGPADAASRAAGEALGVSFAGSVTQGELAEELRSADCLVLPSRNDSFGMVVPEALASGVPVIVSDHVGARDLVVAGRNGWVVPFEDVDALAARLLAAARDPVGLERMRPLCRESAAAATWEAYHARFVELVSALLAERAGAGVAAR